MHILDSKEESRVIANAYAELIAVFNQAVISASVEFATTQAISSACYCIQNAIGQNAGDFASVHFSGDIASVIQNLLIQSESFKDPNEELIGILTDYLYAEYDFAE